MSEATSAGAFLGSVEVNFVVKTYVNTGLVVGCQLERRVSPRGYLGRRLSWRSENPES